MKIAGKVDMCREYNYSITKTFKRSGQLVVKEASMSKLLSTKNGRRSYLDALQMLGKWLYGRDPMARIC
jgi:hypothetical protein